MSKNLDESIKKTQKYILKLNEMIDHEEKEIQTSLHKQPVLTPNTNLDTVVASFAILNKNLTTLKETKVHLKSRLVRLQAMAALSPITNSQLPTR